MKKLIPLLLAVCLLITPMMGKVFADDQVQAVIPDSFPQADTTDIVFSAGSVPADSALLDGIQLPIHALMLSMTEHEQCYDIQSPDFVWTGLYYALSMYGEADDRAQLTQDALLLPSESVYDFARALFAQLEKLPQIPAPLTGFINYETTTDIYRLSLGDFAQTQLLLGELAPQADGSFVLDGTLNALEDSTPLCSFRVILQENDTMFGFSVVDVSLD
ncbi:MAG: hypothetical protein E7440_06680 [Ruminococcaceae bacterium]|nr:hypothetical protein [Oscillospiraceae bacterium]